MSSKGLSSRLQGLKFMQRGAAREGVVSEKTDKMLPPKRGSLSDSEGEDEKVTPSNLVAANAEHWVVPAHLRVNLRPTTQDADSWDTWFLKATETDLMPVRQQFGARKKRRSHKHGTDDDEEDQFDAGEEHETDLSEEDSTLSSSSDSEDEENKSFESARSADLDRGFRKPPSATSSLKSVPKRRASQSLDAPRAKLVAVADKSQTLRKKKRH